jgi:2-keto-4-pentenoate hydratase/2-oxohepta-3-ene-1,7-dioic acid hydratase in catechol pathway
MRLVTYTAGAGPRAGLLSDDGVIDIERASNGRLPSGLLELLARENGLADAARVATSAPHHELEAVRLLAPVPRPPKLLAVAANYQAHIVEGGLEPVEKAMTVPKLFLKPATTIIGPGDPLQLPRVSKAVDWEVELAAVIGRRVKDVDEATALDVVAGYTIVNDVSARRMSWRAGRTHAANDAFFDWLSGKWPDGFAPMGPSLVTADEAGDPQEQRLSLRVNGEERQSGSTRDMIFSVAELVAFASRLMTLEPGDVLATGTPAGVGDTTATYLEPGDLMEAAVGDLGVLRTPVVAAPEQEGEPCA